MSALLTLESIRSCLTQHGLFSPDTRLVAAISGGSDSMALLYGLHLLQREAGFTLSVCHVQHGLRGEASLADEQLVQDTCRQLGTPCTVYTAQLGGDLHQPGMETRARDQRRKFYAKEMAAQQAQALLLAHHLDDQAETLLLHLLRGTGGNGLCGMQESSPFADGIMLRPFLALSKQQLLEALAAWDVPHREDASNQEALTLRNTLRLAILPQLEGLWPGCTQRMAQTARLLRRDEEALQQQAESLYEETKLCNSGGLHALSLHALQRAPKAVSIRTLRLWYTAGVKRAGFTPQEQSLSAEDSEALLTLALAKETTAAALNLPFDLQASTSGSFLHLQRQNGKPLFACPPQAICLETLCKMAMEAPYTLPLPGWEISLGCQPLELHAALAMPETKPSSAMTVYLPLPLTDGCLLRTPRPGDIIRPMGAPGHKPLRRYLTDRKIAPPFRPLLPVLAKDNTILWIPGLCTAQALVYQPGVACLCLSLTQPPPYLPSTTCKGDDHHG